MASLDHSDASVQVDGSKFRVCCDAFCGLDGNLLFLSRNVQRVEIQSGGHIFTGQPPVGVAEIVVAVHLDAPTVVNADGRKGIVPDFSLRSGCSCCHFRGDDVGDDQVQSAGSTSTTPLPRLGHGPSVVDSTKYVPTPSTARLAAVDTKMGSDPMRAANTIRRSGCPRPILPED